jgi:PD-(D/E)XK nuclease superfamily
VPVLCLVPTPLAAVRAARRLCDAQGGVLFGPAVSTLDRLVPGVLAAAGDRRAVLTPLAERLLAVEAGAAAGFAGLSVTDGLAASLAGAVRELRGAEVTAEETRAAAGDLEGAPAARLRALAGALDAYEVRLAALGALDGAAALRAAADAARRGASSPETADLDLLVVDGIATLQPAAADLLVALVDRARRTRVHLPFFPERPEPCASAEPLLRRLEAAHELAARRDVEIVLPQVEGDGRAARPAALLAAFAGGRGGVPGDGGRVLARAGAGEEGEAEAAAAVLADLLAAGFGPEEIAVVSASPRRAAPLLARACAARGVPFAGGRGPALGDVPVVRAVVAALEAAEHPGRDAVERVLGTAWFAPRGLPPLGPVLDRAGAFDGRLGPAEALRRRAASLAGAAAAAERGAVARAAEAVERLVAMLRPVATPGTARVHATHLGALVEGAGLRRRAARGPRDAVARDLAALAGIEEAAEAVARAFALLGHGGASLAPGIFRAALALAIEGAALPPGSEPAAGAVELWGLDEAPGLALRAVVVTGCARGQLPPAPPPEPLLRDPERIAVNRRLRRAALPVAAARRAEALHRVFCAAAAGREAVAFTWAAPGPAGGGGPLAPVIAEALAAAGVEVPAGPGATDGLATARTARAALRAAVRLGAPGVAALGATPLAERAADALRRGAIEVRRRAAVLSRAPAAFAGAVAGPALSVLRAALPEEWTASQLEGYARCPFRALLGLARLPDRAAAELDIDPRDEGSLLHAVLEAWVAVRMARGSWPPAGSAPDLAEARAAAALVLARFEREGRTGDPAVWAARREAVLARLDRIVQAEARDHGGLAPVAVEHHFGGRAARPPLELAAHGETVRLRGRIDRVDAGPDRLLVLDYKNARSGDAYAELLEDDALGEVNFQVPVYLMVAARDFPGRARLEAGYALLRKAERLEPVALLAGDPRLVADAADAKAEDGPRPFAAAVVEAVRRFRAGAFPIASRSCAGCPHGAVCRFEGAAALSEDDA